MMVCYRKRLKFELLSDIKELIHQRYQKQEGSGPQIRIPRLRMEVVEEVKGSTVDSS